MDTPQALQTTPAGVLDIAWHGCGPSDGPPVFLMHGFPYDIHAYGEVAPLLAQAGCRVIVPYLRGFGPTRFLRQDTPRSGEQAALGADLLALMDALEIPRAVLAGYDWGGRAACVVAALWPGRCTGLVSYNNYNIQSIARGMEPDTPENEHRLWYQYYFHSERGRAGLARNRRAFTRLLWQLWSPTWKFDEAAFARSAAAFDNEDFVDVVIHSYRQPRGRHPAGHHRAHHHLRWRRRWRARAGPRDRARPLLRRPPLAPDRAGGGAQHAAGGAWDLRGRRAGTGARRQLTRPAPASGWALAGPAWVMIRP